MSPAPRAGALRAVGAPACGVTGQDDRLATELRDLESTPPPGPADLYSASIRGVLSLGPRRGQRIVRFFGQAARAQDDDRAIRRAGYGFDLWARQGIPAGENARLEKLARYVLRPTLAEGRLSRLPSGGVVLRLKRPWRDGTTAMVFEPLDFLGKLPALVPWPRTNTIRLHGVYAAAARERAEVVPDHEEDDAGLGECASVSPICCGKRLSWAQPLARISAIGVFSCPRCKSRMSRIAWMTDSDVVRKILNCAGLAADSPVPHPPRSGEEVFGEASAT